MRSLPAGTIFQCPSSQFILKAINPSISTGSSSWSDRVYTAQPNIAPRFSQRNKKKPYNNIQACLDRNKWYNQPTSREPLRCWKVPPQTHASYTSFLSLLPVLLPVLHTDSPFIYQKHINNITHYTLTTYFHLMNYILLSKCKKCLQCAQGNSMLFSTEPFYIDNVQGCPLYFILMFILLKGIFN